MQLLYNESKVIHVCKIISLGIEMYFKEISLLY